MSNIKIVTSVVVAAVLAGAACAHAGQGGGVNYGGGGHSGGEMGMRGASPYGDEMGMRGMRQYGDEMDMRGARQYGDEMDMRGAHQYGDEMDMRGVRQYGGDMDMRGAPRYAAEQRSAGHSAAARANSGGQHSVAPHGRPESDGHRDVRTSRNGNAAKVGSDRSAASKTNAVRNASSSGATAGALHNTANLRFPNARAQIVEGRGDHGWRLHRHGGFGWAGPLFWPFAYHDIYDYALWGYGYDDPFWDYGYADIYAGIFSPYSHDDLAAYQPQEAGPSPDGGSQVQARPHVAATAEPPVNAEPRPPAAAPPRDTAKVQPHDPVNAPRHVAVDAPPRDPVNAKPRDAVNTPPQIAANAQPPVNAEPHDSVGAPPRDAVNAQPQIAANAPPRDPVNAKPRESANAEPHIAVNVPPHDPATAGTRGPQAAAPSQLARMCDEDGRDIAGIPIDQIRAVIAPNDVQRASLDDLANASVRAAEIIRAACPTQIALTAPGRLTSMRHRVEAMISAAGTVQPALQKFYDLLSDEQKMRLSALGQDQSRAGAAKNRNGLTAAGCSANQGNMAALPTADIEAKLHLSEAQRASLADLQDATARAAEMLQDSCPASDQAVVTPPARLDAVGKRLQVILIAVKTVRAALDDFYAGLSDEQKAQFETIGQRRSAASDQPSSTRAHVRRHDAS